MGYCNHCGKDHTSTGCPGPWVIKLPLYPSTWRCSICNRQWPSTTNHCMFHPPARPAQPTYAELQKKMERYEEALNAIERRAFEKRDDAYQAMAFYALFPATPESEYNDPPEAP